MRNNVLDKRITILKNFTLICVLTIPFMGINLYITSTVFVPSFYAFAFVAILIIIHGLYPKLKDFNNLLAFLFIPFLSVLTGNLEYINERFQGLLVLGYSSILVLLFWGYIKSFEIETLRAVCFFLLCCTVIFVALERTTPMSDFFYIIRDKLYPVGLYINDKRDIAQYGFVRPKFLFSEPAHLALHSIVICWCYLILSGKSILADVIKCLFISALLYILVGSPIYLLGAIGSLLIFSQRFPGTKNLLFAFLLLLFGLIFFLIEVEVPGLERLQNIIDGKDGSANHRLVMPFSITVSVLSEYPIWGTGISGSESAFDSFSSALGQHGIAAHQDELSWKYNIHSVFLNLLISFGLVGFLSFFIISFVILAKRLPLKKVTLFFALALLLQLTWGAIILPRYWLLLALIALFLIKDLQQYDKKEIQ